LHEEVPRIMEVHGDRSFLSGDHSFLDNIDRAHVKNQEAVGNNIRGPLLSPIIKSKVVGHIGPLPEHMDNRRVVTVGAEASGLGPLPDLNFRPYEPFGLEITILETTPIRETMGKERSHLGNFLVVE
jgi:hypothetical protein